MIEIELASLNAALPVENTRISHVPSFRRCFLAFYSSHRPTRDNQGGCLFSWQSILRYEPKIRLEHIERVFIKGSVIST